MSGPFGALFLCLTALARVVVSVDRFMGLHSFNAARKLAAARLAEEQAAIKPLPVEIEEIPEVPTKRAYKRRKPEPEAPAVEPEVGDEQVAEQVAEQAAEQGSDDEAVEEPLAE